MDYSRNLAIRNLTSTVEGELSLGDKTIIKKIALEDLYSSLEKTINQESPELSNWERCVRTDLHDWPKNQLISYGFKIKHNRFLEIKL